MPSSELDRLSYQSWQSIEAAVLSPLDRTPSYWKYVISTYWYHRSRLEAPGRAYDSEEYGMLPLGGSAHADIMDLDLYLATRDGRTLHDAAAMAADASPESVAYWRGMGRGNSATTVRKRRDDLAADAAAA